MGKTTDKPYMNAVEPFKDPLAGDLPHGAERRRHTREATFTAGVVFPDGADNDEHRISIYVFNVSRGGLAFRSQRHFCEGDILGARLGAGPLHLSGRIKVLNCRVRPDGTCDVNAQFI